jgi:hypothetical protein
LGYSSSTLESKFYPWRYFDSDFDTFYWKHAFQRNCKINIRDLYFMKLSFLVCGWFRKYEFYERVLLIYSKMIDFFVYESKESFVSKPIRCLFNLEMIHIHELKQNYSEL